MKGAEVEDASAAMAEVTPIPNMIAKAKTPRPIVIFLFIIS
jgi:hypothetical protein